MHGCTLLVDKQSNVQEVQSVFLACVKCNHPKECQYTHWGCNYAYLVSLFGGHFTYGGRQNSQYIKRTETRNGFRKLGWGYG